MAAMVQRRGRPARSAHGRQQSLQDFGTPELRWQRAAACIVETARPALRGAFHTGPRQTSGTDVRTLDQARQLIGPLSATWRAYLTVPLIDGIAPSIAALAGLDDARVREGRDPQFPDAATRAAAARLLSDHGIAMIALRRTPVAVEYLIRGMS